jgi:hypothetical protein
MRDYKAKWTDSDSTGKEHDRPKNEHGCPESENERLKNVNGRNTPNDQDNDNGYI